MGYFTEGQAAQLAKSGARVATLVDLEFTDDPKYLWNGFGKRLFGGNEYIGCGDVGSIEGLEDTRGPVSQQVTFTLSGVADSPVDLLATVLDSTDIVQGNLAIVSLQFFDNDWQAVGNPVPIYFGVMMPPRVTREAATETTGARRTIVLPTENLFFGRHRPPAGRYTDTEQRKRFEGDRFCQYTTRLASLTLIWPDY